MNTTKLKKISKKFTFPFPVRHKVVRDLRIVTELVSLLMVEGTAYLNPNVPTTSLGRYSVDIDFILCNGVDIKAVLEARDGIEDIEEAALSYASGLFTGDPVPDETINHPGQWPVMPVNDRTGTLVVYESLNNLLNKS